MAIAAIYLLSILATGGYPVNFAGVRFDAYKLWPANRRDAWIRTARSSLSTRLDQGRAEVESGFIVFALASIVFLANGRTISGGDGPSGGSAVESVRAIFHDR